MKLVAAQSSREIALTLSRDLTRALKRGHPWVFSDALRERPPAPAGAAALLTDKRGKPVARGMYDPGAPLAFRACTTDPRERLDDRWAERRLEAALALREAAVVEPGVTTGFRLFNGEGDGVPGLVCDVYGDTAVVKLDGEGPRGFWDVAGVAAWVGQRLGLRTVYERERTRGGPRGEVAWGEAPPERVRFLEHGLTFAADVVHGQKTGFFLDQRDNRRRVRRLAGGRRVLNVFGYTGGFSVYAGAGGATHVTTVDIAAPAIADAQANWTLNGLPPERHDGVAADAFAFLEQAAGGGERWELVVCDPPSFAPSRQALDKALPAYTRLFAAAARVTAPGGLLCVSSCSSHVGPEAFQQLTEEAVGQARRRASLVGVHDQPADHPTPLAFRDFRYLKFLVLRLDD